MDKTQLAKAQEALANFTIPATDTPNRLSVGQWQALTVGVLSASSDAFQTAKDIVESAIQLHKATEGSVPATTYLTSPRTLKDGTKGEPEHKQVPEIAEAIEDLANAGIIYVRKSARPHVIALSERVSDKVDTQAKQELERALAKVTKVLPTWKSPSAIDILLTEQDNSKAKIISLDSTDLRILADNLK